MLTLTLTDNHDLVQKFLSAIPSRKSAMPANTLYVLKFVSNNETNPNTDPSEELVQGPYMAARVGFKPATQ